MTRRMTPPFRADHVGSLQRPRELIELRDKVAAGAGSFDSLRALEDRCILELIALQERVGLQSVTDGELRRSGWRDQFFESVDGFSTERFPSDFFFTEFSGERRRGVPVPRVEGRLARVRPMIADDFAWLKPRTKATAKATMPAPSVTHFFRGDAMFKGSPYATRAEYFAAVAAIYRQEVAALAAAGCTYLQIDEVPTAVLCDPRNAEIVRARGENPDLLIDDYLGLINAAIADKPADMTVVVHLCRGNMGHGQASGGYAPVAERLFNLDVAGFVLEYDTERAGDFAPLQLMPKDKIAVLGLVSTKHPELEPADMLKRRLDEAGRMIDLEQVCISPQCGFASGYKTERMGPGEQERKLAHLVKVAEEVWG
jgi:5-methyltetrahydropteroyltriglutamate--homocysteine methyltransferase